MPDDFTSVAPTEAQDDFTPIGQTQSQAKLQPQSKLDQAIDFIRPFAGSAAGLGAVAGVGALTRNPIMALGAETQGYAGIDTLMQYLKSKKPSSFGEALTEGEKQAAINAVAGRLVHGLIAGARGMYTAGMPEIYKLTPTVSQALESYGQNALATIPRFLENYGASAAKSAALDRTGGAGFTQALTVANAMNKRMSATNIDPIRLTDQLKATLDDALTPKVNPMTGARNFFINDEAMDIVKSQGQETFKVLDDTIKNPDKLAKVLNVGQVAGSSNMNVKRDLQAYQFMKLVQDATTKDLKGNVRIDPDRISETWNDPKMKTSFDTLYGKELQNNISDFFKNIAYTQDKGSVEASGRNLRYVGRGKFLIGIGALAPSLYMGDMRGAIPAGVILSANGIGRMLSSKMAGQILMQYAEGVRLKVPPAISSRALATAMQGFNLSMIDQQGNETPGTLDSDPKGDAFKFVPQK